MFLGTPETTKVGDVGDEFFLGAPDNRLVFQRRSCSPVDAKSKEKEIDRQLTVRVLVIDSLSMPGETYRQILSMRARRVS